MRRPRNLRGAQSLVRVGDSWTTAHRPRLGDVEIALRSPHDASGKLLESPFRVKGTLYLGTKSFFEKNVPGGVEALRVALGPGPLLEFFDQKFLTSSWYEVLNVPRLIAAEARAMRLSERQYLRHRTQFQAEQDIGGVFRFLLKVASPELLVPRLPKVMTQMFNFGKPVVEPLGPRAYRLRLEGIPSALGAWLHTALEIYVEQAVLATGGRNPLVAMQRPEVLGTQGGFPLIALEMRVSWE